MWKYGPNEIDLWTNIYTNPLWFSHIAVVFIPSKTQQKAINRIYFATSSSATWQTNAPSIYGYLVMPIGSVYYKWGAQYTDFMLLDTHVVM